MYQDYFWTLADMILRPSHWAFLISSVSCSVMSDSVTPCIVAPSSSVHGIFQARIPEWVAIPFSRGSSWPRDQTHISWWLLHCRWILHLWATGETPHGNPGGVKTNGQLGPLFRSKGEYMVQSVIWAMHHTVCQGQVPGSHMEIILENVTH